MQLYGCSSERWIELSTRLAAKTDAIAEAVLAAPAITACSRAASTSEISRYRFEVQKPDEAGVSVCVVPYRLT